LEDAAVAAGDQTIGEEIRQRLEASFVSSLCAGDQKTADFVDAIATVAVNVRPPYGPWHENPHAFAVFSAAMTALLAYFRPQGDIGPPLAPDLADALFGPDAPPEIAGRILAGAAAFSHGIRPAETVAQVLASTKGKEP